MHDGETPNALGRCDLVHHCFTDVSAQRTGLHGIQKRGQFVIYSIAADNLTNALYGFLSPFCPQARKIAAQRKRERKGK